MSLKKQLILLLLVLFVSVPDSGVAIQSGIAVDGTLHQLQKLTIVPQDKPAISKLYSCHGLLFIRQYATIWDVHQATP